MKPTPASNRDLSARNALKISDLSIIYGFIKSKIWQHIETSKWGKVVDLVVLHYFRFNRAIYALIYWSPIRYKLGSQTFGILAYLAAMSCCIGYNSTDIHPFFKPFSIFITPFLLIGKTKEEYYDFFFLNIESEFILVFSGFVVLTGLLHLMMIWIGKSNSSMSKRGNSYLVLGLSKYIKVNEFFVVGIFEPLLALGVSGFLWFQFDDKYGAIFLGVATLSETIQQIIDQSFKEHLKSIIRT